VSSIACTKKSTRSTKSSTRTAKSSTRCPRGSVQAGRKSYQPCSSALKQVTVFSFQGTAKGLERSGSRYMVMVASNF
jgi:hypothetical protein